MTFLLALLLLAGPLAAQSLSSGSVGGVVRGGEGEPIGGAMLTLVHRASGVERTATPGGTGRFDFAVLPPGEYTLRAEQFGFRPLLVQGLLVRPGQRLEVPVELGVLEGPAERVDTLRLAGALLAGTAPGSSVEVPAARLHGLPTARRELTELSRLGSLSGADLESQGLPAWLSTVRVDGVEVGVPASAALGAGTARTAALPLGMFQRASLTATNPDVEWSSTGAALEAFTARGGRGAGTEVFGQWGEDALQGGFRLAGAIIPDTATFLVGVEASRLTRAPLLAGVADPAIDPVQWVAREVYGVGPGGETSSERLAAFGTLGWQLSGNTQIDTRASFASLPMGSDASPALAAAGPGRPYEGRDFFVGTTVSSRLSTRVSQELRLSVDGVSREFAEADPLGLRSPTHIVSTGAALGPDGVRPRSFARTGVRASEAIHLAAGAHRLKLGLAAELGWVTAEQARLSETFFSDADAFEAGEAYAVRTELTRGRAELTTPRAALFAQDTWTAGPGLDLLFGLRLDYERLPDSGVRLNQEWLDLTGLDNRNVAGRALRLSPRVGFRWDVQERHRWVVTGSGGVYSGQLDPLLLAGWISGDGSARVSRGEATWSGWPAAPTMEAEGLPTLTLLNPGFRSPRTLRGDLGIGHSLGGGTALRLEALYRHTDFLPRAVDLNLAPDPVGTDQHGRPLYGQLRQLGGILYPESGSNRRFPSFDQVLAIEPDGRSTYRALSASVEHRAGERLDLFARYTLSRTEDNWSPAGWGAPGAALAPRVDGSGDWMNGVSDFDVPHRLVVGAEVGTPALAGLRAALLYRFESGTPFTPGFRTGVDANGDGSSRNDPAFIDAGIEGMEPLLAAWGCLADQVDAFARRNSCRGDARHLLDARMTVGFARFGGYAAALVVDAIGLLGGDAPLHDTALYLVDSSGEITRDAGGRVTVPLVANENFGRSLGPLQGRSLRIGLRVSH